MPKTAILLPLFGRPDFTIRILDFYNRIYCKYPFYIPDGSKIKEFDQKILNKKFPNLKIIYKKYPYDKNFPTYARKMSSMSKKIKEKYIMLIANDDFFNLEFCKRAEKILDKNKELSIVSGIVKNIRVLIPFKSINDHGFVFTEKIQYYSYGEIFKDVTSNDKSKRVKNC